MSNGISDKLYEVIRKHFETGVPIERLNFNDSQRQRVNICLDAYSRMATDPFIDIDAYLRNKFGRTACEIRYDRRVIDYIASFYQEGQRNITKMKVRHASDLLLRTGADTGDMKALAEGAKLAYKLEQLDLPDSETEMSDDMARMPIIITTNVNEKYKGKIGHDSEAMKRIRSKYGVKQDEWQEKIEREVVDLEPVPAIDDSMPVYQEETEAEEPEAFIDDEEE